MQNLSEHAHRIENTAGNAKGFELKKRAKTKRKGSQKKWLGIAIPYKIGGGGLRKKKGRHAGGSWDAGLTGGR